MSGGLTTQQTVVFGRRRRGQKTLGGAPPSPPSRSRVPRLSRLMALAIRLETLIRSGEVRDQAELARLGMVTRARVTQIMGLLNLAPDIQEQLLFLPAIETGRSMITERTLRPIVAEADWGVQRRMWAAVRQRKIAEISPDCE